MNSFRTFFLLILMFLLNSYSVSGMSIIPSREKGRYPCRVCGKIFTFDTNRIRHSRVKHKGLRYQCKICRCIMNDSQRARNHVWITHGMPKDQARSQLVRGFLGADGEMHDAKQCESRKAFAKRRRSGVVDDSVPKKRLKRKRQKSFEYGASERLREQKTIDGIDKLLVAAKFMDLISHIDDLD